MPKEASSARSSGPAGGDPPPPAATGAMVSKKSAWFTYPPPLFFTAVRRFSGTESRRDSMESTPAATRGLRRAPITHKGSTCECIQAPLTIAGNSLVRTHRRARTHTYAHATDTHGAQAGSSSAQAAHLVFGDAQSAASASFSLPVYVAWCPSEWTRIVAPSMCGSRASYS